MVLVPRVGPGLHGPGRSASHYRALDLMEDIQRGVDAVMNGRPATDWAALISRTCAKLGMERFLKNPLFAGTIEPHLPSGMRNIFPQDLKE